MLKKIKTYLIFLFSSEQAKQKAYNKYVSESEHEEVGTFEWFKDYTKNNSIFRENYFSTLIPSSTGDKN